MSLSDILIKCMRTQAIGKWLVHVSGVCIGFLYYKIRKKSAKSVLTEFNLDLLYIRLKNYIYLYNVMPLYAVRRTVAERT